MNKLTKIGGILLVLLALMALIGSSWTFAQEDPIPQTPAPETDDTAVPEAETAPVPPPAPPRVLADYLNRDLIHATVAEALGLTVDELDAYKADRVPLVEIAAQQGVDMESIEAAVRSVVETAVAEALADEAITQEQADNILANDLLRDHGPRGPRGGGERLGIFDQEAMQATLANALGITVEELEAYHEQGLRLPEIAETLGVELDAVQSSMEAAREAAIEQALQDGTITQAQADRMLSGEGCGPGHQGGPRGGGPRGQGGPGHGQGGFGPGNGNGPAFDGTDA